MSGEGKAKSGNRARVIWGKALLRGIVEILFCWFLNSGCWEGVWQCVSVCMFVVGVEWGNRRS